MHLNSYIKVKQQKSQKKHILGIGFCNFYLNEIIVIILLELRTWPNLLRVPNFIVCVTVSGQKIYHSSLAEYWVAFNPIVFRFAFCCMVCKKKTAH